MHSFGKVWSAEKSNDDFSLRELIESSRAQTGTTQIILHSLRRGQELGQWLHPITLANLSIVHSIDRSNAGHSPFLCHWTLPIQSVLDQCLIHEAGAVERDFILMHSRSGSGPWNIRCGRDAKQRQQPQHSHPRNLIDFSWLCTVADVA